MSKNSETVFSLFWITRQEKLFRHARWLLMRHIDLRDIAIQLYIRVPWRKTLTPGDPHVLNMWGKVMVSNGNSVLPFCQDGAKVIYTWACSKMFIHTAFIFNYMKKKLKLKINRWASHPLKLQDKNVESYCIAVCWWCYPLPTLATCWSAL